jgi:transitional endoplasmic reticulum ATPase
MPPKPTVRLVPVDSQALNDRYLLAETDEPDLTLDGLLRALPALCLEVLDPALLQLRLSSLTIKIATAGPNTPLYLPPGLTLADFRSASALAEGAATSESAEGPPAETGHAEAAPAVAQDPGGYPVRLSDREAVLAAHAADINEAASYLDGGLSVLIRCEKLLGEHLAREIIARSGRVGQQVRASAPGEAGASDSQGFGGGRRADMMSALQRALADANPADVIVIPHLDLLAGGSDATLSGEARELTDMLYERTERIVLAFTDPSLVIPEVLASRFAIRLAIDILPRTGRAADGTAVPIGRVLVTAAESALFEDFDPVRLYKHVAGMNAIRLRHGLRYAYQRRTTDEPGQHMFDDLLLELRRFKARTSSTFELPNVELDDIGGYEDVKAELGRALEIIGSVAGEDHRLPENIRHELVPRGFILHGPPGTGKTLFAKAIATKLDATILVVSGPEITDMYVGESERKLRDLFTEARRNAPAVLVFDEFDSIAGKRTGRDDGGSRAGNAIVAQLLTEMDGFRPEVPVLIIGTTNRIDIIDDALLRPSRFRPIKIELPDEVARRAIAKVHADHFGIPHRPELLDAIATATEGMNGDEIRSIFRDARADQLVGEHRLPDARRLGELIGALSAARQQREIEKEHPLGRATPGLDRRSMVVLTTRRPVTADLGPDGQTEHVNGDTDEGTTSHEGI